MAVNDLARLVVALEANTAAFERGLTRAERSFARFTENIKRSVGAIAGIFAGGLGVAAVTRELGQLVDEADKLRSLSQVVGLSVESLSELSEVAKRSGSSAEELAGAVQTLNSNIAAAAAGNKKAAEAFAFLGLSAKDSTGDAKNLETVIGELANRIAELPQGSAVAQRGLERLVGSANLAPFFRQGAQAIEEARERIRALGGTISTDFANSADKMKTDLADLKTAFGALGREVLKFSSPILKDGINFLTDAVSTQAFLGSAKGLELQANEVRNQIKVLEAQGAGAGPINALKSKLEDLEQQYQDTRSAIQLSTGALQDQGKEAEKAGADLEQRLLDEAKLRTEQEKRNSAAEKAAAEAQRVREAQAEASIALTQLQLDQESELLENQNRNNLISFESYYNRRAEIQRQAIDAEIAQQQALLSTGVTDSERVSILNQIELLNRRREFLTTQTVQGIADANERIQDALTNVRADLAQAQGNTFEADSIRLRAQFEDQLKFFQVNASQTGVALTEELINVRLFESRLNELENLYSQFQSRLSAQQDVVQAQQETGLLSERQARQEIINLQKASAAELDDLILKTQELAATSSDPRAHTFLLQLQADYQRLNNTVSATSIRIRESIEGGIISALEEIGPKLDTGIKAFDSFANSVISAINRIAAEIVAEDIGNLLFRRGGGGGGGSTSGIIGSLISAGLSFGGGGGGGAANAGFRASGGPVFSGGSYVVGEREPELFTPDTSGRIIPFSEMGAGKIEIHNHVTTPAGTLSKSTLEQLNVTTGMAVRRAMRRSA